MRRLTNSHGSPGIGKTSQDTTIMIPQVQKANILLTIKGN